MIVFLPFIDILSFMSVKRLILNFIATLGFITIEVGFFKVLFLIFKLYFMFSFI